LDEACPTGFALAMHIQYSTPRFMFQTYPKKWLEIYSSKGLLLRDPVTQWGFDNTGTARWRDIVETYGGAVMEEAAKFGMNYGAVFATTAGKSRSIGGVFRSDRDYLDVELAEMFTLFETLHSLTAEVPALGDADIEALKGMSDRLTRY